MRVRAAPGFPGSLALTPHSGFWGLRQSLARNYGFVPALADGQVIMKPANPQEYLLRHALEEQTFSTGQKVEGLTDEGFLVISQRAIVGDHPTKNTVRKYLLSLGFVNLPARFGQGGGAWFHKTAGVLVMDTAPDNFIEAEQGIVPIDLQIAELNEDLLELIGIAESLLKQPPKPRRPPSGNHPPPETI